MDAGPDTLHQGWFVAWRISKPSGGVLWWRRKYNERKSVSVLILPGLPARKRGILFDVATRRRTRSVLAVMFAELRKPNQERAGQDPHLQRQKHRGGTPLPQQRGVERLPHPACGHLLPHAGEGTASRRSSLGILPSTTLVHPCTAGRRVLNWSGACLASGRT
jgi:hypothetical protein